MQTTQQVTTNGEIAIKNGIANGIHTEHDNSAFVSNRMNCKYNEDLVRIIGQHLLHLGLSKSVEALMQESGCRMDHPVAVRFREHVIKGCWAKANTDLLELKTLLDPIPLLEMQFLLLEQKYLEFLEEGKIMEALATLQHELTPLNHRTKRVHQLSGFIMCATPADMKEQADWSGKESRSQLMKRLQQYLPPSLMLPAKRLDTIIKQSTEWQSEHCVFHNQKFEWKENMSLVVDHMCSRESFPTTTRQIMTDHTDEVWFCIFSPDGTKLATGSKDQTVIIWDVHETEFRLTLRRTLEGHQYGASYLSWSWDSIYLIVCGPEDSPELWVYNTVTGDLHIKISPGPEDSLTCAAWHPDSRRFVTGGMRGQFYQCDLDGNVLDSWEGVRVHCMAYKKDAKTVLVADSHHRIRGYTFDTTNTDFHMIKSETSIMSFTMDKDDRHCLVNVQNQGIHLWDLEDRVLVRKFQGLVQGFFVVNSCFGGLNQSFVASGSEDTKVYIWNIRKEHPIAILPGHTRTVTCVSWNPKRNDMLASVSDDGTIRIWGPSPDFEQSNNSSNLSPEYHLKE